MILKTFLHGYTENQILNQRCLYMFDEFVKFAQTYQAIQMYHPAAPCRAKKSYIGGKKLVTYSKGTYCRGLQKRIRYLYNQLDTLKQHNLIPILYLDTVPMQNQQSKIIQLKHFINNIPEYKALKSTYQAHTPSLSNAIEKRVDAYNNMTSADYALQYASKSYNLNNNVKQLLSKYEHDTTRFTQCYGNQLEHAIHQESLDLLDHIDQLSTNSILYDHQEALVDFTVAMVDYNHEGLTDKAMNDC